VKESVEVPLRGGAYALIVLAQSYICARVLTRHVVYYCNDGDPGPGGGFSIGILGLAVLLAMSVIGYHLARYVSSALRSRGAGPWSALGAYFMLSPVLPILFWGLVPALARAIGMCR